MEWLANNESSLSAIAAIIAIIAGLAVVFRLVWVRMAAGTRPAFLSDWRNIALMAVTLVALLLALLMATNKPDEQQNSGEVARLTQITGKPSVAVLPLNSLSDNPEQAYLADGIAEDVITLLSRNPRFFVIARNSSFTYKGQSVDIRQVGEELGVRYVVEGSVRKIGERLRVTVQLIDTSNGQHLWAEQYDRSFADIFALQDDITNGIASALGDEIWRAEIARASSTATDNLDAWGLVMRATSSFAGFNRLSAVKAKPLLRAALALDPDYALAKAELVRSICWRVVNLFSDNPAKDIAEADRLGQEALQKSPNDPLVLSAVGSCYSVTGRRREAIHLMEKVLSVQPNFAEALSVMGTSLSLNDQPGEGLPYLEKASILAPRSPSIYFTETVRALTLNELSRYEEAEQIAKKGLRSYDGFYWTWVQLAQALASQGDIASARQALYDSKNAEPRFSLEYMRAAALVYKNKGKNLLAALESIWPEDLLTTNEQK